MFQSALRGPRASLVHPSRVTSMVPGSDGSPSDRNQRDPYRAIRAMWASVSTLLTRVGRPRTPDVEEGTVRSRGRAGPPSIRLMTADSSPATNPSGAATTVIAMAVHLRRSSLAEGSLDRRHRAGRNVHDDRVSRHCCGGDVQTVEYEVRCAREQFGVLVAEWFALGPVADHHRLAAGDRCDLASGGETGATAPGQSGPVKQGHQCRSG